MNKKILILLASVILMVGVISGCVEEKVQTEASFEYTSDDMYVGTEFSFTDKSTGEGLTYEWDFDGDGITDSTEQNPTYAFDTADTYSVKLIVTDSAGETSEYSMDIVIIMLMDIVETAIDAGFTTLVTALKTAELEETLKEDGPFTVFAPTNDAFAALNQTWLTALLDDVTNLTKVLTYHVISVSYMSAELSNTTVESLEGTNLTIKVDGSNVYINDIMVTTADIECSNGVIHVIGEVLIPETVIGPTI